MLAAARGNSKGILLRLGDEIMLARVRIASNRWKIERMIIDKLPRRNSETETRERPDSEQDVVLAGCFACLQGWRFCYL